jgi:flavin reductase (DIM6/NTAB) family NADH-FMN oxidoreductase RutF
MLFDFETLTTQEKYKLLVATVVPRPIAWVVTQDLDGVMNAAPYSFFNAFSSDPPVLVIGIGGRKPGDAKDTGANIRETGEFVVNLVGFENGAAMNITAIDFAPEVDELHQAGLTTIPSTKVRPPRIAESPVAFECERLMTVELNTDRSLVMGKVVAMHVRDDCVMDRSRCYIDTPKLDLIGRMHGAGGYVRTTEQLDIRRIRPEDWKMVP